MNSKFPSDRQLASPSLAEEMEYLFQRINYERKTSADYPKHFRLDSMRALLSCLGDPQDQYQIIHVAGTKGKGSVSRIIASALTHAGLKTGVYSSPHLETIRERMVIDDEMITPEDLALQLAAVRRAACQLERESEVIGGKKYSFFEIITAAGIKYFADQQLDQVILEVGLGGRLDSTNVCQPMLCVITNISIDHTRQLGATVDRIAREKAGIIKQDIPLISGATDQLAAREIRETSSVMNAPLWELGRDFHVEIQSVDSTNVSQRVRVWGEVDGDSFDESQIQVNSLGPHQAENVAVAVAAMQWMSARDRRINIDVVRAAAADFSLIGRFEVLCDRPQIVVDMAHNVSSIDALLNALQLLPKTHGNRWLIFASSQDKDVAGMLRRLTPHFEKIILTRFVDNPRAMDPHRLVEAIPGHSSVVTSQSPDLAWSYLIDHWKEHDSVCVTGSAFLIAETRPIILRWRNQRGSRLGLPDGPSS